MTLPSRTAGVVATQGVLLGLSWIFVLLRLGVRKWVVRKMDWDDAFLFLTLVRSIFPPSFPFPPFFSPPPLHSVLDACSDRSLPC
jgi:hypothetical protein